MVVTIQEQREVITAPRFLNPEDLTEEQLTDPDYRLKQLAKEAGLEEGEVLVCSKCHHCR